MEGFSLTSMFSCLPMTCFVIYRSEARWFCRMWKYARTQMVDAERLERQTKIYPAAWSDNEAHTVSQQHRYRQNPPDWVLSHEPTTCHPA